MKIELKNITVRELVEGYVDKQEEGVRGYGGSMFDTVVVGQVVERGWILDCKGWRLAENDLDCE
jgi:hypothetical protein